MLKAQGIQVRTWQRVSGPADGTEEEADEPEGNGHSDIDELKSSVQVLSTKFDALLNVIARAAKQGGG